jgi:hypothetical protein
MKHTLTFARTLLKSVRRAIPFRSALAAFTAFTATVNAEDPPSK